MHDPMYDRLEMDKHVTEDTNTPPTLQHIANQIIDEKGPWARDIVEKAIKSRETERPTLADLAELLEIIDDYSVAAGIQTREEIQEETDKAEAYEKIKNTINRNPELTPQKYIPGNRAERRAAARAGRRKGR